MSNDTTSAHDATASASASSTSPAWQLNLVPEAAAPFRRAGQSPMGTLPSAVQPPLTRMLAGAEAFDSPMTPTAPRLVAAPASRWPAAWP